MALNKATILTAAIANLTASGFTVSPGTTNALFVEAVVNAIVDGITATAVVATTTTCGAGAGTGVGTVT